MNIAIIIAIITVIILGVCFAYTANARLVKFYKRYDNITSSANVYALNFLVKAINFLKIDAKISITKNIFQDSYSVKHRVIFISEKISKSKSISAIAIASHELGHAIQHKQKNHLIYLDYFLMNLNRVGGYIILPLFIVGIVLMCFSATLLCGNILLYICGGIVAVSIILRLLLIPLEYNASKIAFNFLKKETNLTNEELRCVKKILNVAGHTYIGGIFYIIKDVIDFIINKLRRKIKC